jgi:glycosyltransferase involved in cell wall biosynthesis
MNVLQIHNFYQERGGEDAVVLNERAMLESRGHRVIPLYAHSSQIARRGALARALLLPRLVYNHRMARKLGRLLDSSPVDVVHIHNFWPLISPSVLCLLNRRRVPWVQTIHNYRYLVPDGILLKEDLQQPGNRLKVGRRPLRSYRHSLPLTFLYSLTAWLVRRLGPLNNGCGIIQVLSKFSWEIHSQVISSSRIVIKGNFVPDSQVPPLVQARKTGYYLFLGRLSGEKGVEDFLDACARVRGARAIVAGDGPLRGPLEKRYAAGNVEFVGFVQGKQKALLLAGAKALVLPSVWLEQQPISVMEASFAATPTVASAIGGLPEMVHHGHTGLLFESGNVAELASLLQWADDHPVELRRMGENARRFAQEHFSEQANYRELMRLYAKAISFACPLRAVSGSATPPVR